MPDTLYTIPFSHYCEAGRWALQASGSAFREVQALPGLHRLPFLFPAKDDSGDRVTPYVLPSNPTTLNATARPVLRSSWDILAAANRGGVPEDVKETLDAVVGPAERSLFYSFVLDDPCFDCLVAQASWVQRALWAVAGGRIKGVLRRMMVRDEAFLQGERARLADAWQQLTDTLQGGSSPFGLLPDGQPNAATIALCAVAGVILSPEHYYGGAITAIPLERWPPGLRDLRAQYVDTPLGRYILHTYRDTRMLWRQPSLDNKGGSKL
mmetsp:Transcript_22763/g.58332  ORF Transcript_22763/g.58332 Transcript_22763/m.58332 type:complete len:267 (-) Transcript_22763:490-1290(-)|eukprot:jgi/Tetstr1/423678/TSEL_014312.t1